MFWLNKSSRRGPRTSSTTTNGGARWALETRARSSTHIETWRGNARKMAQQFAPIYGSGLLDERHSAIEELRIIHISHHPKYTLQFVRHAWGTLNRRWGQEIRELPNLLRLHAGAERPTFDQLRTAGMTIRMETGRTVYHCPTTFDLKRPDGYFVQEALRRLMGEKVATDWKQHHGGVPARTPNDRTGSEGSEKKTPSGPPLTACECRIDGATAPAIAQGKGSDGTSTPTWGSPKPTAKGHTNTTRTRTNCLRPSGWYSRNAED